MRTRQSYLARAERRKAKFARKRKRKEEKRITGPAPDYPPIRIPGALRYSVTLRDHRFDRVKVIELREPERGRIDQYSATVDGKEWPKYGRPVGISEIRKAITL